jgi:hypothetical protein
MFPKHADEQRLLQEYAETDAAMLESTADTREADVVPETPAP